MSASGISLTVGVVVGADTKGHATLSTKSCSFNVGHLKVKFHGGARFVSVFPSACMCLLWCNFPNSGHSNFVSYRESFFFQASWRFKLTLYLFSTACLYLGPGRVSFVGVCSWRMP